MNSSPTTQDLEQAQILWQFNALQEPLQSAEIILLFGSNDLAAAHRAGQLFLDGWAPRLIVSGNIGRSSQSAGFNRPEAEFFADYLVAMGVPSQQIIIEPTATNTGENISFSLAKLAQTGLAVQSFLLVQAPYMQRRAVAAFRQTNPKLKSISATSLTPFSNYAHDDLTNQHLIEMLVADTQRLELYHRQGFLIKTDFPPPVLAAQEYLVDRGYTKYYLK